MLDFGGFTDFKMPFMSALKLSASVCGSMEQVCSGATIYSSIGICFGAITLCSPLARTFVSASFG